MLSNEHFMNAFQKYGVEFVIISMSPCAFCIQKNPPVFNMENGRMFYITY